MSIDIKFQFTLYPGTWERWYILPLDLAYPWSYDYRLNLPRLRLVIEALTRSYL